MFDMTPSEEPKRIWPPMGMWVPGLKGAAACKQDHPCKGVTAYGNGESCNVCGMYQNGSMD